MPAHCSSDQESYCSALICVCIHAGATISALMVYLLRGASAVLALLGSGYCPMAPRCPAPAPRVCLARPFAPRPVARGSRGGGCARMGAMANRLAQTTSPYLLQHADNPVDWWPWSPEAFEEARRRDVPVLLSVGYASCHWCQSQMCRTRSRCGDLIATRARGRQAVTH
ncbi:DUF255 domain-containing protein [Streptomyces nitrosporeus]